MGSQCFMSPLTVLIADCLGAGKYNEEALVEGLKWEGSIIGLKTIITTVKATIY